LFFDGSPVYRYVDCLCFPLRFRSCFQKILCFRKELLYFEVALFPPFFGANGHEVDLAGSRPGLTFRLETCIFSDFSLFKTLYWLLSRLEYSGSGFRLERLSRFPSRDRFNLLVKSNIFPGQFVFRIKIDHRFCQLVGFPYLYGRRKMG
jgi:hypothetical protein